MKKTYMTIKMDVVMLDMDGEICTDIISTSNPVYGDRAPWETTA